MAVKLTVEPTPDFVDVCGVTCRVWRATSASGAQAAFIVAGVAVQPGVDAREFELDLIELGQLVESEDTRDVGPITYVLKPEGSA